MKNKELKDIIVAQASKILDKDAKLEGYRGEIDRLNATIQRVREIERRMDEYAHRSGPCTGVNCGGCQAGRFSTALRRALEGGEKDERIQAWEAIAAHAAFADCYQEERPLLESVIDRIDALLSTEEAVVELSPSSLQAEIDRLNAILRTTEVGEASCGHTNAMCSKHGDPWPCVTPEASCVSECCDCHATLEEG